MSDAGNVVQRLSGDDRAAWAGRWIAGLWDMNLRTSLSHPLNIGEIRLGPGRIGLTICPGKKGNSVFGEPWDRDLATDLAVIRHWGADAVVSLIEDGEMQALGVPHFGAAVSRAGMFWHHLPISDLAAPDAIAMTAWAALSPGLHQTLDRGGRVLVHCRGGLGRSGVIAALLLIERGEPWSSAMRMVRDARPGAIETSVQEKFLKLQAGPKDRRTELVRASLLGGAIGDALGAEIEFWSLHDILDRFSDGVDDMLAHQGRIGAITDDTQMTLFTAEGLLRAQNRFFEKGICYPPGVVHHALLRWFVTQGGTPRFQVDVTGLVADQRLHVRRAPGKTCMSSLGAAGHFGEVAQNRSKGCGTIMRVAPIALMAGYRGDRRELAVETSTLTHGHPTGQEAAAAWAMILSDVLEGEGLHEAALAALGKFGGETAASIAAALSAPGDGTAQTVEALGGGWVAEEALSIALYAALNSDSFEEGLRIAVTHSGDSDSTGAIAGNLLGLLYPDETMSHLWRREIECADLICRLAGDLANDGADTIDIDRYPGW